MTGEDSYRPPLELSHPLANAKLEQNFLLKQSLAQKLQGWLEGPQHQNLTRCGSEKMYRTCESCGKWTELTYRCSIRWCPVCNWRITADRRKILTFWNLRISQPKHLVLTRRNETGVLTQSLFKHTMASFARLRRCDVMRECKGGCVSMETTHEGRGWHVHLHALLDARFVDVKAVAIDWGRLMGQDFAIVRIDDLRTKPYAQEVLKYVVKSDDMVRWRPERILEFIRACRGVRFFRVFGSLYRYREELKSFLASGKEPHRCECGSCQHRYDNERSDVLRQHRKEHPSR